MRKCKFIFVAVFTDPVLIPSSDGKNPELAHKQILSIAPILPGQEVSHKFDIPPHNSNSSSNSNSNSNSQKPQGQTQSGPDSLIDFGDENAPPTNSGNSNPSGGASSSQDLLGDEGYDGAAQKQPSGLMDPLVPTASQNKNPMERLDSKSSDVDVFVDAPEK
jgi:hypothetical protein